ncbi:putative odorant receptor 83c [Scaptodrosophila lebanonensis]|uniref:Odorant receptor n=1 Tax=Drosophila lebanonensis TaxID=7225 RepID=A0A6J2T8P8_DROLE|nr:putative odorant receptor 83c [Scaptodrosophila lebanonensis]
MFTNSKKPSIRFSKVLDDAKRITMLIGINVMERKFVYKPLTCLTIVLLTIFMSFSIFTVAREAYTSADWKSCLKYCVLVGSGGQCVSRLETGIVKHSNMRRLALFCQLLYAKYEKMGGEYERELGKCVDAVERVIKLIRLGYFVIFASLLGLPIILWLTDGPRYLVLQYHIPGIDPDTNTGFYLTNVVQMVTIVIAGVGLYAGDLYVLIFLIQARLFSLVLKLRVADINALLEPENNKINELAITRELQSIVRWHQLYLKYNDIVNDLTHYVVATQVLTSAMSTTISIFIMLTSEPWPMGYFYLPLSYYSLIVYCILGTQIEYDNDEICYEMYNISWYRMTVNQRKMVRLMIMASQQPKTYKIMSVIPLTVSTALEMTRIIYSLSMMISNTEQSK